MNCGVIATGNHDNLDSLRDAPPHRRTRITEQKRYCKWGRFHKNQTLHPITWAVEACLHPTMAYRDRTLNYNLVQRCRHRAGQGSNESHCTMHGTSVVTLPSRLRPQARASEQPRAARLLASRSERVTIPTAPITHWLSAHADKLQFAAVPPLGACEPAVSWKFKNDIFILKNQKMVFTFITPCVKL